MLVEEAVRFLSSVPPFQFLDGDSLRELAGHLTLAFHPRGEVILAQGGAAGDSLPIIQKGVVKITLRPEGGGEEVVVDYRERGESFGLVSLLGGHQKTTIVALQDTLCYLLPKEKLNELMAGHPAVTEYLLQFHLNKYVGMTSREIQGKSLFLGSSDQILFTAELREIARPAAVTVDPATTVGETARRMTASRQSAALVVGPGGEPVGIVTDSDLRSKVVAAGEPFDTPVGRIMSVPVVTMDEKAHCFEAVLRMLQGNIHHVAVTRGGRLQGLVTNHDFMVLQGRSPLAFSEDIDKQTTLEGLGPVSRKVLTVIGALLREGARAANIIRIISELNDRVVRKVIEIAERELGPPPVPYCWLGLGSEGRKEQTFRTDQDNALVYEDPPEAGREAAATYFRRFAEFVRDGLIHCGFEACPADYMASNPEWCQPLSVWKGYFLGWVSEPTPQAVLRSLILFDFRPLAGSEALAWELREHLDRLIPEYPAFLGFLANMLVRNRPPIGFFGAMAVERTGEHKDGLNLKIKAVAPLVDIARLFALERGIRHAPTWERLEALRGGDTLISDQVDELEYAFEFVSLLRIHHQYHQLEAGREMDNFIHLETLSHLERKSLKDIFRLIIRVQDLVMERYRNFVI
jgi:CBS domain-containing protein